MECGPWPQSCHECVPSIRRHAPPAPTKDARPEPPSRTTSTAQEIVIVKPDWCAACSYYSPSRKIRVSSRTCQPLQRPKNKRRHNHCQQARAADLPPNLTREKNRTTAER